MENNGVRTKQTSIPPPPPPPSFLKNSKCTDLRTKIVNSGNCLNANEQTSRLKYVFRDTDLLIVSYCNSVHSIIQEGPSCGIVALSMASQFFNNIDTSDILACAKKFNFSRSGEVFSAYNMSELASLLLDCDAFVINDLKNNVHMILSHICKGLPVLMPYDADKNHEPGFNNGRCAHWAVISGLCFQLQKDEDLNYDLMSSGLKVHIVSTEMLNEELLSNASNVHVYAYQGKSKHLGVWDLNTLISSNNNMHEVTQKYGIEELVLPAGDTLSELRDKAVLLKKKFFK
nr:UPF0692 protein C19orf54 homolog [Parasteatoda tepidariorum]